MVPNRLVVASAIRRRPISFVRPIRLRETIPRRSVLRSVNDPQRKTENSL
jgi:hypothetical protein